MPETRIKAEKRLDQKQSLAERDLRMREDRGGFMIERDAAILTQIQLQDNILTGNIFRWVTQSHHTCPL